MDQMLREFMFELVLPGWGYVVVNLMENIATRKKSSIKS